MGVVSNVNKNSEVNGDSKTSSKTDLENTVKGKV